MLPRSSDEGSASGEEKADKGHHQGKSTGAPVRFVDVEALMPGK